MSLSERHEERATRQPSGLSRAVAAGAVVEAAPTQHAYGRLALLQDPFGNGFCLLQFEGQGYDEL